MMFCQGDSQHCPLDCPPHLQRRGHGEAFTQDISPAEASSPVARYFGVSEAGLEALAAMPLS